MKAPNSMIQWAMVLGCALAWPAVSAADGACAPSASAPRLDDAKAPPVHLLVQHASFSIGEDGVSREARYSDRMLRAPGHVWVEREVPAALAAHDAQHPVQRAGPHADHAHDEARLAPLLLQRDGERVRVQTVLRKRRSVLDVEPGHHANVGYGGSWAAAYRLIDPAALARMERVSCHDGLVRYRQRGGGRTTLVDWDARGQYARRIEQRDDDGLSHQWQTAQPRPLPAVLPWNALAGYGRGEYSDLLD